jgi:hypothetical protein
VSELDLGIVIVNWNVCDLLLDCLQSAYTAIDAAHLQGEIWVVDNASTDGSVDAVRERFPNVQLIASPLNLGFAGGNNLAMRAMGFVGVSVSPSLEDIEGGIVIRGGGGTFYVSVRSACRRPRYVFLLNPDTVVEERALGEMVQFMDTYGEAGLCGPRLFYGDGRFQHSAYRFPTLAQTILDFWPLNWRLVESPINGRYRRARYDDRDPFPIDHPLGAAMLFRCETVQETHGFDLDYHMYVEEIDWCMRVKKAGWEIYCVPGAEIVHLEGQSTVQVRPEMIVALWRSRYILFGKHYSPLYRWLVTRVIRAGMRTQIRRVHRSARRGEIDDQTAERLIDAYRQVLTMKSS